MYFCSKKLFKTFCTLTLGVCALINGMEERENTDEDTPEQNSGAGSQSPRRLSLSAFSSPGSPSKIRPEKNTDTNNIASNENKKPNTLMRDAIKKGDLAGLKAVVDGELKCTAYFEELITEAIKYDRIEIIRYLIQTAATAVQDFMENSTEEKTSINVLELAILYDFHRKDVHEANSPLKCAIKQDRSDAVSLLLDLAQKNNINLVNTKITTESGTVTPLHWAIIHNRVRIAEILLQHGADLSATDSSGKTARQLIQELGSLEMREACLSSDIIPYISRNASPFIAGLTAQSLLLFLLYILFAQTSCDCDYY